VVSLLLADPRVDPSMPKINQSTPFFVACQLGRKELVSLLLADPRIDPNKPINDGATPFLLACYLGQNRGGFTAVG